MHLLETSKVFENVEMAEKMIANVKVRCEKEDVARLLKTYATCLAILFEASFANPRGWSPLVKNAYIQARVIPRVLIERDRRLNPVTAAL